MDRRSRTSPVFLMSLAVFAVVVLSSCSREGNSATGKGAPGFPASLTFTPVAKGFTDPTAIVSARDGSNRLFVVEQGGRVKIVRDGVVSATPFLDISGLVTRTGSEQGLLDLEFPPDFARRRVFFVNYTDKTGIGNTSIDRFSVSADPDRADPASRTQLLHITQPYRNHNGGELAFGPDGFLYIGTGDGGKGGDPHRNGQRRDTLLGKILRIDVSSGTKSYAIPKGNPFRNEIWGYGLRNPWRFSFDRTTGDLYIADVGQDEVEEVDFQPAGAGAGANYGWNRMEGSSCFKKEKCDKSGLVLPVAEYRHGRGDCSVTGGYVYRGTAASLKGIYLYGDFCSGRIWGLRRDGSTWRTQLLADTKFSISTFGEDEAGEVYVADYGSGTVYRVGAP
ncbi:PQQ-dependent sugar dehydrogenase [Geomonas sp. RF6]|uniref:PQQ-dependent sugar dehydrogenase n=1 Tax=Geomonas sp. RF6 TaxID=2897342 RepID=UPI001E525E7E|nr:PQQ-dependent sugar dehydrogenase [Geomonas sp. RF6]UFS72502.1 PQQ-dependent sugar dehydrogenase [Geomonas sp. RF6]